MKELRDVFAKRGIEFKQVIKCKDIVIYALNYAHTPKNKWFEVFKYKTHEKDKYHDDEYERYPSDESFGIWAWSCSNVKCVEKVINKHFPNVNASEICQICCEVLT